METFYLLTEQASVILRHSCFCCRVLFQMCWYQQDDISLALKQFVEKNVKNKNHKKFQKKKKQLRAAVPLGVPSHLTVGPEADPGESCCLQVLGALNVFTPQTCFSTAFPLHLTCFLGLWLHSVVLCTRLHLSCLALGLSLFASHVWFLILRPNFVVWTLWMLL